MYFVILHVWRVNTIIYQTNKISNFVFAWKDLFPLGKSIPLAGTPFS